MAACNSDTRLASSSRPPRSEATEKQANFDPLSGGPTPLRRRSLTRIMHELPAATADLAVLPGAVGSRTLRRTQQVRLSSSPAVPRDGCPVARPSPRSPYGVSCILCGLSSTCRQLPGNVTEFPITKPIDALQDEKQHPDVCTLHFCPSRFAFSQEVGYHVQGTFFIDRVKGDSRQIPRRKGVETERGE
jgi:hypothetical protein